MEGSRLVQQLLRPTDTCVIAVQGHLLGLPAPAPRIFAVIKHEGSEEHALFLFEIDALSSPVGLMVEAFYPIRGSFSAQNQTTQSNHCQLLLNNGQGSSLVLQLSADTITAVFISQLNKALHQFTQSPAANSPSAFSWLSGYEACRTGWDRFSKPHPLNSSGQSNLLVDVQSGSEVKPHPPLNVGFPETWPWSHIITPNSDGSTEVARCESLLSDFDPLLQQVLTSSPTPTPTTTTSTTESGVTNKPEDMMLSVTGATPDSSPTLPKSSNPFRASGDFEKNPFSASPPDSDPHTKSKGGGGDMRHCISESNISQLEREQRPLLDSLVTRSEEDLISPSSDSTRHCVAKETTHQNIHESEEGEEEDDPLDYKNRRLTRSTDTSPTQVRKHNNTANNMTVTMFRHRLEFLAPTGTSPLPSTVNMESPELSDRKSQSTMELVSRVRGGRKRAGTTQTLKSGASQQRSSKWVSRYRPGVPVAIPGESARESIMQAELRQREREFCDNKQLRVFCGSWNVNGRVPPTNMDDMLLECKVKGHDRSVRTPDIYAIGFQELDLSAQCLLNNESNREELWVDCVHRTLLKHKHCRYIMLCCNRLVGIMLLVYVRESLFTHITDVVTDSVPTGMHGILGNKGGVGVHFNLYHTSLCFVNTHLSAHMEEVDKRNQEFNILMNKMLFSTADFSYEIPNHDMIFWLGDLNYRIQTSPEMTSDQVKAHADSYQITTLLKYDQLLVEIDKRNVFGGFKEGAIDFKPTYKYDPNTDDWDSSEKSRPPAWCDRVLYRGDRIDQLTYNSHPTCMISDHKPVSAIFDATMRVVNPKKEREVLELITWKLDKLENDTLPQVDLNVREFKFSNVRFLVPQTKRLVVTNTGQRPVHISFIPKLDEKTVCKPWLEVKPASAVIHPLEDAVVLFTVCVDEDIACDLNSGRDKIEDILVLHLEKGKDFFISVSGNYLPSCFGSSLETLIHLHTYIREVPVAQLVDLSSSWEQLPCSFEPSNKVIPPPLDIPKELFTLVDFIRRKKGHEVEGLFTDGGRQSEMEDIRNVLDTGGRELPGSVFSMASTLLTFLASLADPVVPVKLHSRCMEACNNTTLCKQTLVQMPQVHKRVFVFLVTFMKDLLKYSETNGLDPKFLATIFGEVMLRAPLSERRTFNKRSLNAMNRKKATFVYQFVINDLTVPYT